jgi:hypothetical protein
VSSITSSNNQGAVPLRKKENVKLPVITCKCGVQILLVPDVAAMSRAIETHVLSHKTNEKTLKTKDLDALHDDLIAKAFEKAVLPKSP